MENKLDRKILRFLSHFRNRFNFIKNLDLGDGNETLKLSLYVSMIDALSRTVINQEDINKK